LNAAWYAPCIVDSFLAHCEHVKACFATTEGIPPITISRIPRNRAKLLCFVCASIAVYCPGQSQEANGRRLATSSLYGSAAVAIIRDDTIVVAADSRTVTDGVVNPDTTCKITVVKDIVFAATGLLKGNQNALDIIDYARSVLTGPEKTRYKLNTFQSGASRLLTSWMNIAEDRDSLAISSDYRNRHSIHSLFCFFSGGKPVVIEYAFMPAFKSGRFKIAGVYNGGVRKPGKILWIGASEQTDSLLKTDRVFSGRIHGMDAVSAAKVLIQKQMEFTPRIVGGDVDIVLVTPKRATWIQHKQNCY
jgi:hypothetical protein